MLRSITDMRHGRVLLRSMSYLSLLAASLNAQELRKPTHCESYGGVVDRLVTGEVQIPLETALATVDSVMAALGYERFAPAQSNTVYAAAPRRDWPTGADGAPWWTESPPEYEVSLNLRPQGKKKTVAAIRVWVGCPSEQWDLRRRERLANYAALQILLALGGDLARAKAPFQKSEAPKSSQH